VKVRGRAATTSEMIDAIIEECTAGRIAPALAVSRLLLAGTGRQTALAACERAMGHRAATEHLDDARARLLQVHDLLQHLPPESIAVASLIRGGGDGTRGADSVEEGIAQSRDFFDRAVAYSEEASVALYSLGRPELLAAATTEIVEVLDAWGLLGPEREILQIGCGIGRLERVLAGRVRIACGIDVSANMLAAASRRCAGLANVVLVRSSGRDLSVFRDGTFDLIYGVDSFPYMQAAGLSLVEKHMQEAHRVLRPRGGLVILNFSYRGDPEQDRRDVARLAERCGFEVMVSGSQPFQTWDGLVFRLQRRD
jgi:SAM-dependent methyltransferase